MRSLRRNQAGSRVSCASGRKPRTARGLRFVGEVKGYPMEDDGMADDDVLAAARDDDDEVRLIPFLFALKLPSTAMDVDLTPVDAARFDVEQQTHVAL